MKQDILPQLNEEQEEAKEFIIDYIHQERNYKPFITISGPGGSGKTFMLKYALREVNPATILGSTISHFAKKVLRDNLGVQFKTVTVAAMLGMKVDYDSETGDLTMVKRTTKSGKPITPLIANFDIIIIDEASMIDDKLFDYIMSFGKKVIAVGDRYQLPPVEQDHDSIFFNHVDVQLVQVMRFNETIGGFSSIFVNEIAKYNDGYNIDINAIAKNTNGRTSRLDDTGSGYIFMKDLIPMLKLAYLDFKHDSVGIDGCRMIAYKNKTIDTLNNSIRTMLFGKGKGVYEKGELIISDGGYGQELTNGDIFRILNIIDFTDRNGIDCHILELNAPLTAPIIEVASSGKKVYEELETYYKEMALSAKKWGAYYDFINSYARFKYSYAISVHKAQGASIKNVYVFEGEIMGVRPISVKEKFQSLYVAVTRARHRVYIYNKKNSVDNSTVNINKNKYLDEST